MRLIRQLHFRIARGEDAGDVFARAYQALARCGLSDTAVRFRCVDRRPTAGAPRPVPAVRRAITAMPALAPFAWLAPDADGGACHVLSNLGGEWAEPHAQGVDGEVPVARLAALARGIPARFPFAEAAFAFDRVPLLDPWQLGPPPLPRLPGRAVDGGLHLLSAATARDRTLTLAAGLLLPTPPADAAVLPEPPAASGRLLHALGPVAAVRLLVVAEPADQRRLAQVRARVGAVVARFVGAYAGGGAPPRAAAGEEADGGVDLPACRASLVAALAPLGYRPVGSGCLMRKSTAGGSVIEVRVRSDDGAFAVVLRLAHPGLGGSLPIPLAASGQQPVAADLPRLLAAAAARVAACERDCVAEVEGILGPVPRWFLGAQAAG